MLRSKISHALFAIAGVITLSAGLAATPMDEQVSSTLGNGYVSTLAGIALPAKSLGTAGTGATVSVIFGHELSPHFAAEVNLNSSVFETGIDGVQDDYQNGATFDLVWKLRNRQQELFTPFVLIGIGGAYDDYYPDSRHKMSGIAEAGVGLVSSPLPNGIRFRLDGRYVRETANGGHVEPRVILGIDIPLGRVEHRVRVSEREVIHEREVIREQEVMHVPMPVPVPVHVVHDTDGDGVDDDHDRCPDTPRGLRVDAEGCVLPHQTFRLTGVNFDFNDAHLTTDATEALDRVSAAFKGQPTLRAEIAGHTDSVGDVSANLLLSQRRADTVRNYLIDRGVLRDQLEARGYGKSQLLVSPERVPADGERNRRVELRVLAR
jgi:OOP family OmpA-OmpF porin